MRMQILHFCVYNYIELTEGKLKVSNLKIIYFIHNTIKEHVIYGYFFKIKI